VSWRQVKDIKDGQNGIRRGTLIYFGFPVINSRPMPAARCA